MNRRDLFVRAIAASSAVLVPNFYLIGHDEPLNEAVSLFDWIRELGSTTTDGGIFVAHDVLWSPTGSDGVLADPTDEWLGVNAWFPAEQLQDYKKLAREPAAEILRDELIQRGGRFDQLVRLDAPEGWVNPWDRT